MDREVANGFYGLEASKVRALKWSQCGLIFVKRRKMRRKGKGSQKKPWNESNVFGIFSTGIPKVASRRVDSWVTYT